MINASVYSTLLFVLFGLTGNEPIVLRFTAAEYSPISAPIELRFAGELQGRFAFTVSFDAQADYFYRLR